MPSKPPQTDALLAFALDLLAQAEAHNRIANRLEVATRVLAHGAETRGLFDPAQARAVREQVTALKDLTTANHNLLTEFNRELELCSAAREGPEVELVRSLISLAV